MTKAKRVLALLLAVIMASLACTTAFARNVDPEAYKSDPWNHMNSINVITLTAEEGCTQILDLLDDLLYNANIKFNHETVTSIDLGLTSIDVKLTLDLSSVDGALWSLWNIIRVAHDHDGDCLGNIVDVGSVGNWLLDTFCGTIAGMLGDLQDLTADSLTDQNINSRVCRNWPVKGGLTKGNDLEVLGNLTHFLSDNRVMLKKVVTGGVELGTIGSMIIGRIEIADKILNDFTGWLRDLLYSKLWDTDADAAPSGFTYDAYAQKLINWLTYEGTGSTSADGGKSVLGSEFEAFLPALENQPGKADIRNQSTYALVNNIIQALLSGMVGDLLKDLLKDLLGAEATDQYPYGDPAIVQDVLFATTESVEIPAGEREAIVTAQCTESGTQGNGYVSGQIRKLVDPFPYELNVENTTESYGGSNIESDENFRERIQIAPESFSVAGPTGAYEYWARSAHQGIIDVAVIGPPETEPGNVNIYPLMLNGDLPTQEILDAVFEVCNAEDKRPDTDYVHVLSPEPVEFELNVKYWIDRKRATQALQIQAAVEEAVNGWITWQRSKLGRDLNPSELNHRMVAAGAKRTEITSPDFKVLTASQVAVMTSKTLALGGLEDG